MFEFFHSVLKKNSNEAYFNIENLDVNVYWKNTKIEFTNSIKLKLGDYFTYQNKLYRFITYDSNKDLCICTSDKYPNSWGRLYYFKKLITSEKIKPYQKPKELFNLSEEEWQTVTDEVKPVITKLVKQLNFLESKLNHYAVFAYPQEFLNIKVENEYVSIYWDWMDKLIEKNIYPGYKIRINEKNCFYLAYDQESDEVYVSNEEYNGITKIKNFRNFFDQILS